MNIEKNIFKNSGSEIIKLMAFALKSPTFFEGRALYISV
jgi:hypothetical protein